MNRSNYLTDIRSRPDIATALVLAAFASLFATAGWAQAEPKYKAKVPLSITTPDTVQTRIGTLKFQDGLPDAPEVPRRESVVAAAQTGKLGDCDATGRADDHDRALI